MTEPESPQPSTRVEREIREILERADAKATPVEDLQATLARHSRSIRAQLPGIGSHRLSTGVYKIVGALVLALVAAGFSQYSQLAAVFLAILSAIAFFSLWFPSLDTDAGGQKRWRGRDLSGPGTASGNGGNRWIPRRPRKGPLD